MNKKMYKMVPYASYSNYLINYYILYIILHIILIIIIKNHHNI